MNSDAPAARSPSESSDGGFRVLVADDDRAMREQIAGLLRPEGYTVETCEDGSEALARIALGGIDLVLLDVTMPRMSGTEACRVIKGMTGGAFLPIILVTGRNDTASRAEGLRMGADDYIGKPFEPEELVARVASMLRIRKLVGTLSDDRDRLRSRSVHDDLTGLPNRKYFETRVGEERKRAERHHEPFACLLIDTGGTLTERSASRAATALKRSVRECDVVARFADGTLAALLPHTHFPGAIAASERVLIDVATALGDVGTMMETISIGAALYPSRDTRTLEALISTAEAALDEAKRAGGGCICVIQQLKYLYTPNAPAPRSERQPPLALGRNMQSEPPPPSVGRRALSEPPPSASRRAMSEPPPPSAGRRSMSEPPPSAGRRSMSDLPPSAGRRASGEPDDRKR